MDLPPPLVSDEAVVVEVEVEILAVTRQWRWDHRQNPSLHRLMEVQMEAVRVEAMVVLEMRRASHQYQARRSRCRRRRCHRHRQCNRG